MDGLTHNQKTDLFLDYWRQLETAAERYLKDDGRGGNVVLRLCRDKRFSSYREQLDYCREVRNLLSHQAKVDGQYPVTPSDAMLQLLKRVLDQIEDPPRVQDAMTPVEKLLTAAMDSPVLPVMQQMRRQGLSHVPLLQNGRVAGVFSVETVFQALLDGDGCLPADAVMADYADYLPLTGHMGHTFGYIRRSATLADAEALFDKAYGRDRKLKLLLVTSDGSPNKPLLGVLSPYDLMGQTE